MARAIWNGSIIAEAERYELVEGNVYFPPEALKPEFLQPSQHTTVCPWKGTANYFDIRVDGKVNQNAAWYYASPSEAAANIKGHVAFWKGVQIEK